MKPSQPPSPGPRREWLLVLAGIGLGVLLVLAASYATRGREARPELAAGPATGDEAGHALALGRRHLRAGRYRDGLVELERAHRLAPQSAEILHVLGQASLLLKRFEPASGYLRRSLELDPTRVRVMVDLALALRELGQAQSAVEMAEQAAARAPGDRDIQVLLGQNLLRAGEAGRAAAIFERVIAAGGGNATNFLALGRARDLLGQDEPAEAAFREAIQMDPGLPLARYWHAQHLLRVGRSADAEKELVRYRQAQALETRLERLEQSAQLEPTSVRLWTELALARLARGDPRAARQAIERAAQLAPASEEVRRARAQVDRAGDGKPGAGH